MPGRRGVAALGGVDQDVGVEEESSAHSPRPAQPEAGREGSVQGAETGEGVVARAVPVDAEAALTGDLDLIAFPKADAFDDRSRQAHGQGVAPSADLHVLLLICG